MYAGVPISIPVWVEGALRGDRHRTGHPEVGDDGVPFLDQDVFRLNVAVDHLLSVCVVERVRDFPTQRQGLVHREPALARNQLSEGATCDIRRHIVKEAVGLTGVVERQQMWVPEPRRDPDLAQETLRPRHLASG